MSEAEWLDAYFIYISKILNLKISSQNPKCLIPKAVVRRCFLKRGILQNFAKFTGKQLCWSLFSIKLQTWRPPKETPIQAFSYEICEIFKNTFFTEHLSGVDNFLSRRPSFRARNFTARPIGHAKNWWSKPKCTSDWDATRHVAFFIYYVNRTLHLYFKGKVIQIEKELIRVLKVSWKFRMPTIYDFPVIYLGSFLSS